MELLKISLHCTCLFTCICFIGICYLDNICQYSFNLLNYLCSIVILVSTCVCVCVCVMCVCVRALHIIKYCGRLTRFVCQYFIKTGKRILLLDVTFTKCFKGKMYGKRLVHFCVVNYEYKVKIRKYKGNPQTYAHGHKNTHPVFL